MPNNAAQIKKFFEPIDPKEFLEFWKGLTEAEKDEFRAADLT